MNLFETLKKPFLKSSKIDIKKQSSIVHPQKVMNDLTGDDLKSAWFNGYNGDATIANYLNTLNVADKNMLVTEQAYKIQAYRKVAFHNSDVKDAITEIVNEIICCYDNSMPLAFDMNEENKNIKNVLSEEFENIMNLMRIKRNIYSIVEKAYIDGQMIFHLVYDDNLKKGIQKIEMIDPLFFFYDKKKELYRYEKDLSANSLYTAYSPQDKKLEYSREEIVRNDFGLYEDNLCLSYLEFGLKNANILKNLEDLLVPLRFSRSVSRRVFNIDVGNLPAKRVQEVMTQLQNKFKYKKFYNNETGEISNQQHITSMVEDYWFPNRSGGRGTTVETLDETGNLGEINDILYFARKLYRSLNVPLSRLQLDESSDHMFDYETTQTSKEDMEFFSFISRLRQVYCEAFKDILKMQVLAKGIMTEKEWKEREKDIRIYFANENKFIEKMKLNNLQSALEMYSTAQEQRGMIFTQRYLLKEIFHMSDEEIDVMLKELEKEEKDPKFARYYKKEADDF